MKNDEYDLMVFKGLDNIPIDGKWLPFDKIKGYEETLLELVKIRIDVSRDFIISNDYKKFKKITPFVSPKFFEMTYHIEFKKQKEQYDYDHLPEPKYTEENKKIKRRA